MDHGLADLEIKLKNFTNSIKNMTVLGERVTLTSSMNEVNIEEMDALVDALVASINK